MFSPHWVTINPNNVSPRYHNSITSQEHRRTLRMRGSANYDTERSEFLCPLCQTLSNTIIPVLPSLRTFTRERKLAEMSFNEWLDGLEKAFCKILIITKPGTKKLL